MSTRQQIDYYASLSDDELWAELGAFSERRAVPEPLNVLADRGRQWFAEHYRLIQSYVCRDHPALRAKAAADVSAVQLSVVLADALLGSGLPVATVAVLVSRMGIEHLCRDVEPRPEQPDD